MIAKELDPLDSSNLRLQARRAESIKIAAQLKGIFQHDPNSQVLNGIRLKYRDDITKIDHLLIHPFGMIVIEGVSLKGDIEITREGQWIRTNEGRAFSVLSPVSDAKMRGVFLKKLLQDAYPRVVFFRSNFIEVVIVVSDAGEITYPGGKPHAEICTSEQLGARLRGIVAAKFSEAHDPDEVLGTSEIHRYAHYLCEHHIPATIEEELAADPEAAADEKPAEPSRGNLTIWSAFRKKEREAQQPAFGETEPSFSAAKPVSSNRQRLFLSVAIVALLAVGVYLFFPTKETAQAPQVKVNKPVPRRVVPASAAVQIASAPAAATPVAAVAQDSLQLQLIRTLHLPRAKVVAKSESVPETPDAEEINGMSDDQQKILQDLCARRSECR